MQQDSVCKDFYIRGILAYLGEEMPFIRLFWHFLSESCCLSFVKRLTYFQV